jgi:hypothetical protein
MKIIRNLMKIIRNLENKKIFGLFSEIASLSVRIPGNKLY